MRHKKSFLGVGWKFPPTFEKNRGSVMLVSEEEDIKESLQIILSTKPGERVMIPDFGCDLKLLAFEPISSSLIFKIERIISKAVLNYEPRVVVDAVNVYEDDSREGIVYVELAYTILKTNSRTNMVYPYYIAEGNNARFKPI